MRQRTEKVEEKGGDVLFQGSPREVLFRSSALDRLSAREELDELFVATPRRSRLPILAAAMLVAALALWIAR